MDLVGARSPRFASAPPGFANSIAKELSYTRYNAAAVGFGRNMKKNVLFVTADQWRGECLSALGHLVRTPNLDALAAEGTLCTRNFANTAPCGPSRASIHTGMYQQNHRVIANGTPLDERHTNWALEARRAGYQPALFGYTDTTRHPQRAGATPDDTEVDEVWDGVLPGLDPVVLLGKAFWAPDSWVAWLRQKDYPLPERLMDLYTRASTDGEDAGDAPAPLAVPAELHDTWFLVDQVLDYIKGRAGWCVHLSLLRPHPPWLAPAPYHRMYPPADLPPFVRAPSLDEEAARHPYMAAALAEKHAKAPADEMRLRHMQAGYFGLMTEVDHNLGRLFDALRASGAWRDTLIIFTSDHGEQMGDHWLIGKLGYFDQSFATPLIVFNPAAPEAQRGTRLSAFTESVDIMPTILDWLGVDIPAQCDGASLLPATRTGSLGEDWRCEAHWEFDFSRGGVAQALGAPARHCKLNVVRGETFKYVHFGAASALPPIYFDLANDPAETINLAQERGQEVAEAAGKLLSWRMMHEDRALTDQLATAGGYLEHVRRHGSGS